MKTYDVEYRLDYENNRVKLVIYDGWATTENDIAEIQERMLE